MSKIGTCEVSVRTSRDGADGRMPRLLPRLLQSLKKHNRHRVAPVIPAERHPRHKPIPESRNPPQCPPISPKGRTQSIVLDSLDPILSLSRYRRHKAANPRRRGASKRQHRATRDPEARSQLFRGMSEEERGFWASPYRMSGLHSDSRRSYQCLISAHAVHSLATMHCVQTISA